MGLDFDNADADFGSACDEQSAHTDVEPPRKKQRDIEQLVPFMGDAGFSIQQLDDWRAAEKKVGIVNVAAKAASAPKPPLAPTPP